MEDEELKQIREYGIARQAERERAAEGPPPKPPEPWARDHPVTLVTEEGVLFNLPKVRRITGFGEAYDEQVLRKCPIKIIRRDGGEFVRAEAVAEAFYCGVFGPNFRQHISVHKVETMDDLEPVLPLGVTRIESRTACNSATGRVYPEVLKERLEMPGTQVGVGLPRGGDPEGVKATKLEDMLPMEIGTTACLTPNATGQILWVRHLPRKK